MAAGCSVRDFAQARLSSPTGRSIDERKAASGGCGQDRRRRRLTVNRLLARSPQILPIPGSGSPEHVEQNVAAAIDLEPAEIRNHQSRDNYLV